MYVILPQTGRVTNPVKPHADEWYCILPANAGGLLLPMLATFREVGFSFLVFGNDSRRTRTGFLCISPNVHMGRDTHNWTYFSCLVKDKRVILKGLIISSRYKSKLR